VTDESLQLQWAVVVVPMSVWPSSIPRRMLDQIATLIALLSTIIQ
jgi:hypothetical protein